MSKKPPRRKVLKRERFNRVSWSPYTVTLECGHIEGTTRPSGKTHGCHQCLRLTAK